MSITEQRKAFAALGFVLPRRGVPDLDVHPTSYLVDELLAVSGREDDYWDAMVLVDDCIYPWADSIGLEPMRNRARRVVAELFLRHVDKWTGGKGMRHLLTEGRAQ